MLMIRMKNGNRMIFDTYFSKSDLQLFGEFQDRMIFDTHTFKRVIHNYLKNFNDI